MHNKITFAVAALIGVISAISSSDDWVESDVPHTLNSDHGQYHVHNPSEAAEKRNFKTGGVINVHVTPHSHDDVGWLKTVDQYFDGSQRNIQWTNVEVELTNVIWSLVDNPDRKFSEVEMKFFNMWWNNQNDNMKDRVKGLIKSGQLELINGGWSMHDEACPTYDDMINNMLIGHEWIEKEFGVKPRIGWQIDPFGHSNANTRLYAEMGFDALFFARLDYKDKEKRMNDKSMEWIWMPNQESLGKDINLLTHALYAHYSSPQNLNFDILDGDEPWINDKTSDTFNAQSRGEDFKNYLDDRCAHYITDECFVLFGDDFRYMNAMQNYENMDAMILWMNENYSDSYNLFYSTPSMYVDALNATMVKDDVKFPTKYDDMFPYADAPDAYWTGYFSSRANDKEYIRRASYNYDASNQLYAEQVLNQNLTDDNINEIMGARYHMLDVLGINQHHDAVTGTGTQAVANDYAHRLFLGIDINKDVYSDAIERKISTQTGLTHQNEWTQCFQTNTTYLDCPIVGNTDKKSMNVVIQNPSSMETKNVKIAVPNGKYDVSVFDGEFKPQDSTVECHNDLDAQKNEMKSCFQHIELPKAVGPKDFALIKLDYNEDTDNTSESTDLVSDDFIGSEDNIKLTFKGADAENSIIYFEQYKSQNQNGVNSVSNETFQFSLNWWSSQVNLQNTPLNGKQSGVYIFRPRPGEYTPNVYSRYDHGQKTSNLTMTLYFEKLNSFTQKIEMRAIVNVMIDEDLRSIKFDVDLNSLPVMYQDGHEVVAKWQVDNFDNNQTFYTDSNGLEMQKRILNYRPTWNFNDSLADSNENITSNFYPVNSAITIMTVDNAKILSISNDRSQSGSAIEAGSIQFMQNRRIPACDGYGMPEIVNETDQYGNGIRVPATYYFYLDNQDNKKMQKAIQTKQDQPLQYFYNFDTAGSTSAYTSDFSSQIVDAGVADATKLYATPMGKNKIQIRLTNLHDFTSDPQTSTINLDKIVAAFWSDANIANSAQVEYTFVITEKTLTGNMDIQDMLDRKIHWITEDDDILASSYKMSRDTDFTQVTLEAQRIRVFNVDYTVKTDVPLFMQ